jgi:hypothetical protein
MRRTAVLLALLLGGSAPGVWGGEPQRAGAGEADDPCQQGPARNPTDCEWQRRERATLQQLGAEAPRVERSGLLLRIRATGGATLERLDSPPGTSEGEAWRVRACDWLAQPRYLVLCWTYWESQSVEYVQLDGGQAIQLRGYPLYSPSRAAVLIVNGYGSDIDELSIWRFRGERLEREFALDRAAPQAQDCELRWQGEREIRCERPGAGDRERSGPLLVQRPGADGWRLASP